MRARASVCACARGVYLVRVRVRVRAGGFVPGQGAAPPNHAPRTFLVTNDCPVAGNEQWCGISGSVDNSKDKFNHRDGSFSGNAGINLPDQKGSVRLKTDRKKEEKALVIKKYRMIAL